MATANYSLFAIPAYMVLAQIPHAYSVALIGSSNNWKWDNSSPRSTRNRTHTSQSVPAETYRKFERCRAAHDNMLENMAFVVGGILAGVVCKLDARLMNVLSAICLASRILYIPTYIQTSNQKLSPLRTIWYLVSNIAIFVLYWKSGWKLAETSKLGL